VRSCPRIYKSIVENLTVLQLIALLLDTLQTIIASPITTTTAAATQFSEIGDDKMLVVAEDRAVT
jgi:hypothetical protein